MYNFSSKRFVYNLSEKLNKSLYKKSKLKSTKSSEFIKDAVIVYIEENKKLKYIEQMKKGYTEMARLNLEISEMGIKFDIEDMVNYELKLSESDMPDDNDSEKRRYILC